MVGDIFSLFLPLQMYGILTSGKAMILKEYYEICSSSHLNRLLSYINTVPKTNLFPKYHMSKHYRTCVKWDTKKEEKSQK